MLQDTDVQSLLATRKSNHSLPRPFYTDPEIFQLDLERIWYKSWLFAVPACEIPTAGNYVTHKVGLYAVMSYFEAPPEIFEDSDAMQKWCGGSVEAGRWAKAKKRLESRRRSQQ